MYKKLLYPVLKVQQEKVRQLLSDHKRAQAGRVRLIIYLQLIMRMVRLSSTKTKFPKKLLESGLRSSLGRHTRSFLVQSSQTSLILTIRILSSRISHFILQLNTRTSCVGHTRKNLCKKSLAASRTTRAPGSTTSPTRFSSTRAVFSRSTCSYSTIRSGRRG